MRQIDLFGIDGDPFEVFGVDGEVSEDEVELGGGCADGDIGIGVVVKGLEQLGVFLMIYANHSNIIIYMEGGGCWPSAGRPLSRQSSGFPSAYAHQCQLIGS